jgi:hypothetical protein
MMVDEDGKWKHIEFATTTVDSFNKQVSAWRFPKVAYAQFYAGSDDGMAFAADASYSTARTKTSCATFSATAAEEWFAFSENAGGTYQVTDTYFEVDTSTIPSGATMISGTFNVYANNFGGGFDTDADSHVVVDSTITGAPTTNDCNKLGTTEMSDRIRITATSKTLSTFTFNSTGLSNVSKGGTTYMGVASVLDVTNGTPSGRNLWRAYYSEQSGTSNDPYYTFTYSTYDPNKSGLRGNVNIRGGGNFYWMGQ